MEGRQDGRKEMGHVGEEREGPPGEMYVPLIFRAHGNNEVTPSGESKGIRCMWYLEKRPKC